MTSKHTKLSSILADLPFTVSNIISFENQDIITTSDSNRYIILYLTKKEYQTYLDLIGYSKNLKKCVFYKKYNDMYLLAFEDETMTEKLVASKKTAHILTEIFENSSFEVTLKKEHLVNLKNIYKVLDNKFAYFEMRIREIETSPVKDDISWIILAKYNIILDAKIYLYDLQQDIFKAIDKNEICKYGIVFKSINFANYSKQHLLPCLNLYYAPISMLYCRIYLSLDDVDLKDKISKFDTFNKKYFAFMVLYILILNLNLGVLLDNFSVANYLLVTKKIKGFLASYKFIMEK